uniref:RRM domain-containing protein n=1 Tax=Acrobeloides nanus TaxID=290746 RepID=A0A914ENB0_9BILA
MALKWGIICSVPSTTDFEELREFGHWFTECTEASAERFNLSQKFDESPEFVISCEPNSEKDVRNTYRKNSIEFTLLKELSISYAIIGQGILLEKAINRFEGLDLDAVFSNVNQYISRRLAQIVSVQREENLYHMYVGENKFELIKEHDRKVDVTSAVNKILHGDCSISNDGKNTSESLVMLNGFPPSYNQYDVAKLFGNTFYRFSSIKLVDDSSALMEFANKFHAAQAIIELNGKTISGNYTLSLSPLSEEVRRQIVEISNC